MGRGLSADEKAAKILEIFAETKDCFMLKEIEKIASKEKGVVLQSVKDILEQLVGDSLVQCEKMGTQNVYWNFPSASFVF
jgi:hypothetical protein